MAELSEERRERFLRAAIECFARHGYRRTSMEVVAQAADVSRPALYQYFRNKEEIFRAAARWSLDKVAVRAEAAADLPAGAEERLVAILDLIVGLYVAPGRPGGMFYAELVDETYARANDVWTGFEAHLLAVLRSVLEHACRCAEHRTGCGTYASWAWCSRSASPSSAAGRARPATRWATSARG